MSTARTPQWEDPYEAVRDFVQNAIKNAGPQYHTGRLAVEVLERLRTRQPDLLSAWLDAMAIDQLKLMIGRIQAGNRRRGGPFRAHVSAFDNTEEVDASHTQRRFGDMVKSDLKYVARQYRRRARTNDLRAKAIEAFIKKMPNETITLREVVTEEEVERVFQEI